MTVRINLEQIDNALSQFTIPPRPEMLRLIQQEVEREEPDLKVISSLIEQDIGVTSFTLKVVNSPLFSLSRKVKSIEHACTFLGLARVCKLVQSVVLRFTLSEGDETPYTQKIWDCSNAVGISASVLAREFEMDLHLVDDCYTLGLFHNAGMALAHKLTPDYKKVITTAYNQHQLPLSEVEEFELSMSHEVLGYLIANSWSLPDHLCEVIAYHHHHDLMLNNGNKLEQQLFAILKLSEHMLGVANFLGSADRDIEWERYGEQVLDILHIDNSHLNHLTGELTKANIVTIYSN